MTPVDDDFTLDLLRRLPVVSQNDVRSRHVRMKCQTALDQQRARAAAARSNSPARQDLASGLAYVFSAGYLFAVMFDVVRVFMRR